MESTWWRSWTIRPLRGGYKIPLFSETELAYYVELLNDARRSSFAVYFLILLAVLVLLLLARLVVVPEMSPKRELA